MSRTRIMNCKKRTLWAVALVGVFALLGGLCSFAQQTTSIGGQVTDSSGASVPRARIVVRNTQSGEITNAETTATGDFRVKYLHPGIYDVTATATGFETAVEAGIHLELDASVTVNLKLRPGLVTQSVIVTSDEAQLNTKPDRGEVFSTEEIENAPLNGGNPLMIAQTQPGVYFNGCTSCGWVRPFDNNSINLFSANGQGSDTNDFQVDGAPNNTVTFGARNIGFVPPTASVEEMKIITNPYDAQYGHTGGAVFDVVTKSGNNQFHGQIYENARRTWLDANTHYANNPIINLPKGKYWIDQYGGELDGPVRVPKLYDGRDKTLFMAQYEGYRSGQPFSTIASVPALDPDDSSKSVAQTGNFSQAYYYDGGSQSNVPLAIYDPLTNGTGGASNERSPFPNNQIPVSRLDPVAQKILSFLPLPNRSSSQTTLNWGTNNYVSQSSTTDIYKTAVSRVDRTFSDKDRAYLRFVWNKRFETRSVNGLPGVVAQGEFPLIRQNHSFVANWNHVLSTRSVVNATLSFARYVDSEKQGVSPFDVTQLGWPGSYKSSLPLSVFPEIEPSGYTYFGNWADNGGNRTTITNAISFTPQWTLALGRHNIKAGLDSRWLHSSSYSPGASAGELYFDGAWTRQYWDRWNGKPVDGNSWASMLLGTASGGRVDNNANQYFSYPYFAPYFQDDWKVTSKLTLNLGVRWDFQGPPSEANNKIVGAFDSTSQNPIQDSVPSGLLPSGVVLRGGNTYAGVNGQPRTIFDWDFSAIQPRFGFAYSANSRTVVRGGIGTSFAAIPAQGYSQGFSQTTSYVGSNDNGFTPIKNVDNPFPVVQSPPGASLGLLNYIGNNFSVSNRGFRMPGVENYSLGVESQLTSHLTTDISYVGSRGYRLDSNDNINHISSQYSAGCNIEMGATPAAVSTCVNQPGSPNAYWVKNPFQGIEAFNAAGNGNGFYSNGLLSANQFTRPFPEFGDINQSEHNEGQTHFNSLQFVVTQRWSNAFTYHASYVWSKTIDTGGFADTVYRVPLKYVDLGDRTNRFTFNGVWHVPVGRGRKLLGNSNRVLDAAVGGWIFSPVYIYERGTPWGLPGNIELLKVQHFGVHRTVEGGVPLIRGTGHCIEQYDPSTWQLEWAPGSRTDGCSVGNADFRIKPPYAVNQDYVDTGIRQPNYQQLDVSASKVFALWKEDSKLEVRLDGYNILNHPTWDEGYWGDPHDPHFGTLNMIYTGQSNPQRQIQLVAKITW